MIRVVSYNIQEQELSPRLITSLDKLSPDIIMLQEVEEYTTNTAASAASEFGYECTYVAARELPDKGTHGLAILSKYKIENLEIIELPFMNFSLNPRKRIALHAQIEIESKKINICNIHLDTRLNVLQRVEQLSPILDRLKSPVVLGGDFNTIPFKFYRNLMPVGFVRQRKYIDKLMLDRGYNFFEANTGSTLRFLPWKLDAIYTLGFDIINHQTQRNIKLSDHFPILVDLNIIA